MSYLQHICWQKGNNFFATYSTPDITVCNQPLLKAIQRLKIPFLTHQRKGISLAEVICIAIMSYLQHICWQKGNIFLATYSTPDITVHPEKQQSTTVEGHSKA